MPRNHEGLLNANHDSNPSGHESRDGTSSKASRTSRKTGRMFPLLKPRLIKPRLDLSLGGVIYRKLATLCEQKELKEPLYDLGPLEQPPLQQLSQPYQQPSVANFSALLQKCGNVRSLPEAKHIHALIKQSGLEQNSFLGNRLIWTYDKCGSPKDAWNTFEALHKRDIVSWNMMIGSYAQHGRGDHALRLFKSMLKEGIKPDKVTFLNTLNACNNPSALNEGRLINACILHNHIESNIAVSTALVNMYGKCGDVEDARRVFEKMAQRNVISWTAMISAYAQKGLNTELIHLFTKMQQAGVILNKITFVTILSACSSPGALADGKLFHAYIVERKPDMGKILGTSLVSMYGRCGSLNDARSMFDKLPLKQDVVLWTAMITAYTDYDCAKEALGLFQKMMLQDVKPNKITFASILEASANAASLQEGKLLHWHAIDQAVESDLVIGNALVNMYSKCGSVKDARVVFNNMREHDVISWNAVISSCAQHGHGKEVIQLFQQMKRERVKPDKITFISVLAACSHAGLVDEACYYFTLMRGEYHIKPNVEHYRCVGDLLGRVGRVEEAEELIRDMPYVPGAMAWSSLLGACKVHGNVEHGKDAAGHVLEFDPQDVAAVALFSKNHTAAYTAEGK